MNVPVHCPACGHSSTVAQEHLGKVGRCPGCKQKFRLAPSEAKGAAADAPLAEDTSTSGAVPAKIGRYVIRQVVGSGAFGRVYRAYEPDLDREIALKVPHPELLGTSQAIQRFLREAKAAAQLRHPHIVPIYNMGHVGRWYYISSAFIAGRTLESVLEAGPMETRRGVAIVRDLAGALAYAHGLGIVHRDVKPANIMIDEQGRPHLMDFGLAYRRDTTEKATQEGAILGTPSYMSPEQAAGRSGDPLPASDQYSLGVVLYEILCGETPFGGPSNVVIFNILHSEPRSPRTLRPGLSLDLETICLKAMARLPEQRYASCDELTDDLRRWLDGEPIRARRPALLERAVRWCRRRPALAGMAAALVGALLLGSAVSAHFARQANRRAAEATTSTKRMREEQKRAERVAAEAVATASRERAQQERADREAEAASAQKLSADRQTLIAQRNRYAAQMHLARGMWNDGRQDRLLELLNSLQPSQKGEPDLRGWEWHYLESLCHSEIFALRGHQGTVADIVYSPDGNLIASADTNGVVKLWDRKTGAERFSRDLAVKSFAATPHIAFAPGGERLIATYTTRKYSSRGPGTGILRLYDIASGKALISVGDIARGNSHVVPSPSGSLLVTWEGDNPSPKVWDLATCAERCTIQGLTEDIQCAALNGDGSRLAIAGERGLLGLWDTRSGKRLVAMKGKAPAERYADVTSMTFQPEKDWLVTGDREGIVRTWDMKSGREQLSFKGVVSDGPFDRSIDCLVFQPHTGGFDPTLAVVSASGKVVVWVFSDRLSFDGFDALSRPDRPAGAPKEHLVLKGRSDPDRSGDRDRAVLAFSPDGKWLALKNAGGACTVWDTTQGTEVSPPGSSTGELGAVAFGPQGKTMAVGVGCAVRAWEVWPQRAFPSLMSHTEPVACIAFSADGRTLASGGKDGVLRLWQPSQQDGTSPALGRDALHWSRTSVPETVAAVTFSPDGTRVATGSLFGKVKTWESATGRQTLPLVPAGSEPAGREPIADLGFSPDGALLISGSQNGIVRRREVRSGRVLSSSPALFEVSVRRRRESVPFSPDWSHFATEGSPGKRGIQIWEVASRRMVQGPEPRIIGGKSLAFALGGTRLVVLDHAGSWSLLDATTGREVLSVKEPEPSPPSPPARQQTRGAARSGGGQSPPSAEEFEKVMRRFPMMGAFNRNSFFCLAISPDGKKLATGNEGATVIVWDVATGRQERTLQIRTREFFNPMDRIGFIALSRDGAKLAVGGSRVSETVWDVATGQYLVMRKARSPQGGPISIDAECAAFSPDGTKVAFAGMLPGRSGGAVTVFDARSGQEIQTLEGFSAAATHVGFSADGARLGVGTEDGTVSAWDLATSRDLPWLMSHQGKVASVAFSPDGTRLASGGGDRTVKVWDATSGKEVATLNDHDQAITCLAFAPDGKRLASGTAAGTIRTWDAKTGVRLPGSMNHNRAVSCVAFSPDQKSVASGDAGGSVRVWLAANGESRHSLKGHETQVSSLAFSPDGRRLATAAGDGNIKCWDVATGQEVLVFKGHDDSTQCLAFSPDGARLASGSSNGTLRIWDAETAEVLLTVKHSGSIRSISFQEDGIRLGVSSPGSWVSVWNGVNEKNQAKLSKD